MKVIDSVFVLEVQVTLSGVDDKLVTDTLNGLVLLGGYFFFGLIIMHKHDYVTLQDSMMLLYFTTGWLLQMSCNH